MRRLLYDLKTHQVAKHLENVIVSDGEFKFNRDFFDYHNTICPRCQKPFRVSNNTVRGVGTLSTFHYTEKGIAYLYAACKDCSTSILAKSKGKKLSTEYSELAQKTEEVILKALGEE